MTWFFKIEFPQSRNGLLSCCVTSVTGFCAILGVKTTDDRKFILQNRNPEHVFTALLL